MSVERHEQDRHVYCPALTKHGAASWGYIRDEAWRHIEEVIPMVLGQPIGDTEGVCESREDEFGVVPKPRPIEER